MHLTKAKIHLICLALLLLFPLTSKAALAVNSDFSERIITAQLSMALLPENIEQIDAQNIKKLIFKDFNSNEILDQKKAFILRLSLENTSEKNLDLVIGTSLFDYITLFYVDRNGNASTVQSGLMLPHSEKMLSMGANSYLPFSLPKGKHNLVFYIKNNHKTKYQYAPLPFTLYQQSRFDEVHNNSSSSLHFFLGAIIIMTFYNLALYFVVRKKFYLYYIINNIFILFFVLALDGNVERYFFANFQWHEKIVLVIGNLSFIFYMLFTTSILNFKKWDPIWDKRVQLGLVVWLGMLVFVFLDMEIVAVVIGSIGTLIGYTITIVSSIKGIRAGATRAMYFLIGNLFYYAGVVISILQINGILHSTVFGLSSIEMIELTTMLQLSLFSLTLGSTINYMREKLDKKEIEQQKHEREAQIKYAELIEQKNIELEHRVAKRTQALRDSTFIIQQKNKDITNSITYARRIQRALLPAQELWKSALKNHFVFYKPKDIVSGDFYWLNQSLESNTLFFAACDCTGHGVPGAMVSVVGVNNLNRCINEFKLYKPSDILNRLNLLFQESFEMGSQGIGEINDGMDIALCALDYLPPHNDANKAQAKLQYSGANNPLWIIRKTGSIGIVPENAVVLSEQGYDLIELKANKQPIGRFSARKPFVNEEIDLYHNDHLYLFSDGYADQFGGPDGKKFKLKQLKKLLMSVQNLALSAQKQVLYDEFVAWQGKEEQVDDMLIIGVKI